MMYSVTDSKDHIFYLRLRVRIEHGDIMAASFSANKEAVA